MDMMRREAAQFLLTDKERLAREITEAMYAERPGLLERYGERGREKCLQDMRYNIEHLVPAVDLNEPDMFANYIRWLDGLLRARGVATDDLLLSLTITSRVVEEVLGTERAAVVSPVIEAGTLALQSGGE